MSSPGGDRWQPTEDSVGCYRGRGLGGLDRVVGVAHRPEAPKHCRVASGRGARPDEERIRQRLDKGVDAGLIVSNPCRRARGGLLARPRSAKTAVFAAGFQRWI